MRAKPYSVQHRVILLQASGFALALWLLAGTFYVNLRIERELKESIHALETELRIHAGISSTLVALRGATLPGRQGAIPGSAETAEGLLRLLADLLRQYPESGPAAQDLRWHRTMEEARVRLEEVSRELLTARAATPQEQAERRHDFDALCDRMQMLVQSRTDEQLNELSLSHQRLGGYTLTLTVLFAAIGLFGMLALWQAQRVLRGQIWEPLEDLRQMALQVRGGNLAIAAAIPTNLEFGTLVQGFLEMAAALRQMRDSLEEKVKERTAKLETAQRELVQTAKLSSLGLLVSGVAHEINNPLTSILGFSELALARGELDAPLRNSLEAIRSEAIRLKGLVSNLGAFSRRAPQRCERSDLRLALDRVVELRRYQLHAINIELHYDRPEEAAWVEGDPDELLQVFFNLVLNSEQAIAGFREHGDIWLACGTKDAQVWATVRDDGAGIPAEIQDSIFDPFFTTKPVGQGTGLGLSISHGIVQRHRGAIQVASAVGDGTTMRVVLPAAAAPSAMEAVPTSTVHPPGGVAAEGHPAGARRVRHALVLDDEPLVGEFVKEGLASRGWTAEVCMSGEGLESFLLNSEFDLVVCDLKMPGRNGLEVLRVLRGRWPRLAQRFVLMTGNLADADPVAAGDIAGIPVLRKPFTLAELTEAIRGVTGEAD